MAPDSPEAPRAPGGAGGHCTFCRVRRLPSARPTSYPDLRVKTGIQVGIQAFLAKIGLGKTSTDTGQVDAKALHAKEAKGHEKGQALGDGALLAGIGFNPEDKQASTKNLAEKANIDRFMQDPGIPHDGKDPASTARGKKEGEAAGVKGEGREPAAEPREMRDLAPELRREEKADEARMQAAQDTREQKEQHEAHEKNEADRQRDEREKDDDQKRGGAWVQEELEREEEEKKRGGLRLDDALGDLSRCRGVLEDGTLCLRRPVQGTPYCREHATRQ